MAEIDLGSEAIERDASSIEIDAYTRVEGNNAANDSGTIDYCEVFLAEEGDDTYVGTFSASGNVLTCRDSELIGDVASGSKQTFSGLDIDVETGDYIGINCKGATGRIERDTDEGAGYWGTSGEYIDPEDSTEFYYYETRTMSLYGTGETEAALQTLTPGGIASAEAIGSLQANLALAASGIATAEALGSPQANLAISASGIATAEALGTLKTILYLLPGAISSGEGLGEPQVNLRLAPASISSAEAIGAAALAMYLKPNAITSLEALGTPSMLMKIIASAIASAEAVGTPELKLLLAMTGIESAEAIGSPSLSFKLYPGGIASDEALGEVLVFVPQRLLPDGIASAEALGTLLLIRQSVITSSIYWPDRAIKIYDMERSIGVRWPDRDIKVVIEDG